MKLIVFSFILSEHIQPIIYAFAVEEPETLPVGSGNRAGAVDVLGSR
jgi:hypothetical protein